MFIESFLNRPSIICTSLFFAVFLIFDTSPSVSAQESSSVSNSSGNLFSEACNNTAQGVSPLM